LTIPVHSAGVTHGIEIRDVKIDWSKPWQKNHLKALTISYNKAPYFKKYLPLLEKFYSRRDESIADFAIETTKELARELGIRDTRFMRASELEGINGQKTDRLIQILTKVGTTHYISGPSARDYIEQEKFEAASISLEYIVYDYPEYPQLYPPFDSNVTIMDLLFMTGEDALKYMMKDEERK
jgi:hypothetical protein